MVSTWLLMCRVQVERSSENVGAVAAVIILRLLEMGKAEDDLRPKLCREESQISLRRACQDDCNVCILSTYMFQHLCRASPVPRLSVAAVDTG